MVSNYFTLKGLTDASVSDAHSTFKKMTALLNSPEVKGKFQFQILKGETVTFFHIDAGKNTAKLNARKADVADFEIITSEETWLTIASGTLSPLRAFLENKMRIRGNIEIGERFLQQFSQHKSAIKSTSTKSKK